MKSRTQPLRGKKKGKRTCQGVSRKRKKGRKKKPMHPRKKIPIAPKNGRRTAEDSCFCGHKKGKKDVYKEEGKRKTSGAQRETQPSLGGGGAKQKTLLEGKE